MTPADFYASFAWLALPLSEVMPGDLYANGATITEVIVGPAEDDHDLIPVGRVRAVWGDSGWVQGVPEHVVVVGRKRKGADA